ncbi:ninjurin-1 isoform X2 [Anastrepha ludens]|uniref:ninjurin-1 isoform X2 n=1 Tax=Anastrepha ludens TaxID=28586 RepID=UPI0023B16B56|nr:ninjurin-1 isoform X2 [Anastrepha ludens]
MARIAASVASAFENDSEMKAMDANRYATKKTIAQGMLDIALLTANASQLKYVLQVGEQHQFYKLMLVMISLSIILQVLSGVLSLSLSLQRDCKMHKPKYYRSAHIINNIRTGLAFFTATVNIFISAFDTNILLLTGGQIADSN